MVVEDREVMRVCTEVIDRHIRIGVEGRCASHMLLEIRAGLGIPPDCLCTRGPEPEHHTSWCPRYAACRVCRL